MAQCVRRRTDGREDADGATKLVAIVGECLLNILLEELYSLVRLFIKYMPKRSHRLIALVLDPRFAALTNIIVLNKTWRQGKRLGFEKT